ncbi:MAG: low molecular weight phosphotyrosine protein phosphatase [Saprospiraceae bacterium]|nr:low molecular weight phosphotyrosine protein phosphatase [Saprospiraceae bacterium]
MKILMVCLGNICRSPLAEGITRQLLADRKLSWQVDSAGTAGWHEGASPDSRSIDVARNHQIDISHLKARRLTYLDLQESDLIIAMDSQNYQDIRRLDPKATQDKLYLIMNFLYPDQNRAVPDPYYGTSSDFEEVCQMLFDACNAMLDQMVK